MEVSVAVGARHVSEEIKKDTDPLLKPEKGGMSVITSDFSAGGSDAEPPKVTYGDILTDNGSVYETIEITPHSMIPASAVRRALLDYTSYEVLSL